jgi:Tol biopolymer transport system component
VRVIDWARDGKTFLVLHRQDNKCRLGVAGSGDKEVRVLTELKGRGEYAVGRFSPNGAKVLFTDADPADKRAYRWGMSSKPYLLDVAAKKVEPVAEFPENAQALWVAWSPDGKRIAYTWKQLHADLLKKDSLSVNDIAIPTEAFLIVADANGRNAKTVSSAKGNALKPALSVIDWR